MSDISSRTGDRSITDYSPLSQECIKALTDRFDDKRKFAADQIEKMTAEFSMSNNLVMINRLIIVLGRRFCLSHHQNTRKGGLLGLAAVMVGFKNGSMSEPPPEMIEEAVRPILTCLLDSDARVRHYACESLFNVAKVARANILPQLELIFDSLSRMVADNDIQVRAGSEALDRLLKDIIVESTDLRLDGFVAKLEEYIYTKNPYTRMFIISWIRLLDSKMDMISYLPHLLDGIFNCLYDSTEEIRASILVLLSEFLNKIVTRPTDQINMSALVNILLKHTRNEREGPVQYTAIAWIRQLIRLMDGSHLLTFTPGILGAILPCLAFQLSDELDLDQRTFSATTTNSQRYIPSPIDQGNICEISTLVNSSLLELVINVLSDRKNTSNIEPIAGQLEAILELLSKQLQQHEHPVIRLAVLDWFKALRRAEPEFISAQLSRQKLFQPLLSILSARSDAVVENTLRVITEIFRDDVLGSGSATPSGAGDEEHQQSLRRNASGNLEDAHSSKEDQDDQERRRSGSRGQQLKPPLSGTGKRVAIADTAGAASSGSATPGQHGTPNIQRFIQALYKTFHENDVVFEERGNFIVMNLCSMIGPDKVYSSFAEIIKDEKSDLKYAYNLVQKLNQILLTTQPLFVLRSRLSNDETPEVTHLFHNLYLAWCHSPIAAITLCLLTNNYRHANEIVLAMSRTDITVELLIQIDWIVQLIESPVFAQLRMRLLDSHSNQYLIQALYGLLMILPQSEAYKKLSHRLDQVHKYMEAQTHFKSTSSPQVSGQKSTAGTSGVTSGSSATASSGQSGKEQTSKRAGLSMATPSSASSSSNIEALMKHFYTVQNLRTKNSLGRNNDVD